MAKAKVKNNRAVPVPARKPLRWSASPILRITLSMTVLMAAISFLPRVISNTTLVRSFWGSIAFLLVWQILLLAKSAGSGRRLTFEFVPRRQHYVQACVQTTIFAYWGWHWPTVYDQVPLFVAQLAFAYAFDSLLNWSRRDSWQLGFGPFPIILSTNIFIWFRDDWYYLQFLMIAVGFLAKEFIRWNREGKLTHIFNPSAFSLGVFSFALVLTGSSDLTVGQQIATTLFMPPYIFVFLFLLGLIAMYFFATTLVAGLSAMTMFGLSALYTSFTGVYWFVDAEIPIAVFLGLHLLVTDPATSPRSLPGKAIFGLGYGLLVFLSFGILGWLGIPTFYDKLLPIPILNLAVRAIDRFVNSNSVRRLSPAFTRLNWSPRQLNIAFMSVWIAFFIVMSATGRASDFHPGKSVPFWQKACDEGRPGACRNLLVVERIYCEIGSGWACNEYGANLVEGKLAPPDSIRAAEYFTIACRNGFAAACSNRLASLSGGALPLQRTEPAVSDFYVLLRGGKGELPKMEELVLYAKACDQGWLRVCRKTAATSP